MTPADHAEACETYLDIGARSDRFPARLPRYNAALKAMADPDGPGLSSADTVVDVAAGWTELDYVLRTAGNWRGRYIPVDGAIDGIDLRHWTPPRPAEWFVLLEIIEHMHRRHWSQLVRRCQNAAFKGVIISTPNPLVVDVLAMDPTHVTAVYPSHLVELDFDIEERRFYGTDKDALFAVWLAPK